VRHFPEDAEAEVADHRADRTDFDPELVALVEHMLPPREASIVVAHVGLGGVAPVPLTRLAREAGVTRQAVSLVYRQALARLKERLVV
jgi:DNA-directed RNA polymerase sigma subunit (sigma70/sigma32)